MKLNYIENANNGRDACKRCYYGDWASAEGDKEDNECPRKDGVKICVTADGWTPERTHYYPKLSTLLKKL
jgi:hypothetical protein